MTDDNDPFRDLDRNEAIELRWSLRDISAKSPAPPATSAAAAEEDPAPSAQMPAHPNLQNRATTKESKTADQLAEMILSDLQQVNGCPKAGVTVTVYGLDPWNSWLHFGGAAGPVRNKEELQEFCTILTDRLKSRYDILP
jgi:hypothetical protein